MDRGTYSEEEIEALITGTERGLIRFAMRYLKDHAGACDAVQDAYIRYVRFLQGPPPGVWKIPAHGCSGRHGISVLTFSSRRGCA